MITNNLVFFKKVFLLFVTVTICISCLVGCVGMFSLEEHGSGNDKANNAVSGNTAAKETGNIITNESEVTETASPTNAPVLDGNNAADNKSLKITYLDVGQGDSAFVELSNGKTMLIDASETIASDDIISYISECGYKKIDYLVATHPHADHIGGMRAVVEAFDIGEIYMPKVSRNTLTYERLLLSIASKNLRIKAATAGMSICEGVDIIAPNSEKYEDLNNYSIVIKITHGNRKFLFMGDAEALSENEIMSAGFDVSADVVKVGHHGSGTSSTESFIKATGAKYAVFSVGEGNSYNHPHSFVVERWQNAGAGIYRTDLSGNISVTSDGVNINIISEK